MYAFSLSNLPFSLWEETGKENQVRCRQSLHILERVVWSSFCWEKALLKAISDRLIPGIPDNLRILLVSQVDEKKDELIILAGEDDGGAELDPGLRVTERVVKSDRRREKALMEQESLSLFQNKLDLVSSVFIFSVLLKAHESSSPSAIHQAVLSVRLSREKNNLEEAGKIAQRRSGTRGSEARKQLLKAEAAVLELEQRLVACWHSFHVA